MRLLLLFAALPLLAADPPFSYYRAGSPDDVQTPLTGGTVLMGGGGDVAPAFAWMVEHSGNGDFLVIRARGTDAYNPFVLKQGPANSAATLIVRSREAASDPEVIDKIRKAEAIFFAGGDQWNYINFYKGTPLAAAVQERIDAGAPVGGTSAGLAVLGQYYFSAEFDTVTTAEAIADPSNKKIAIGKDFLRVKHLENLITDSHYSQRNRQGRLTVFMDKIGGEQTAGLGIDEATAVLLSPDGEAKVVGRNQAHLQIRGHATRSFAPGQTFLLRQPRI
jgi:cyanophycinase